MLEHNAEQFTAEQDWEAEWGGPGLLSRLTPHEYRNRKRDKIRTKMAAHVSEALKNAEVYQRSEVGFWEIFLGFTVGPKIVLSDYS